MAAPDHHKIRGLFNGGLADTLRNGRVEGAHCGLCAASRRAPSICVGGKASVIGTNASGALDASAVAVYPAAS